VEILPALGEWDLYNQFKKNEPWDSEHNKKLIEKMPEVFASPGKSAPPGHTYLQSFAGEGAYIRVQPDGRPLPGGVVRTPLQFTDGTSMTMIVAEAPEPVVWTKPDDLPFVGNVHGPNPPAVPKLGGPFPDGFHTIMGDGRVVFFPNDLSEASLRALITPDAGDKPGPDVDQAFSRDSQSRAKK
jgi:hypothetical protein